MTLEQELKQAEENAEALRRKLEYQTACKVVDALESVTDAEAAVVSAKAAFLATKSAVDEFEKRIGYAWSVDSMRFQYASEADEQTHKALWRDKDDCYDKLLATLALHERATGALKAPLEAAIAIASRARALACEPTPSRFTSRR